MLLELKPEITYGPVRSRRLGRSLGINLLPSRKKVCTFDCVYCQYGWTSCFDIDVDSTDYRLPAPDEVVAAVTEAIAGLDEPPAWLTFSGNGEPTLHPRFPEMVDALLELRDRLAPQARTAILSNSSEVVNAGVRAALARLDTRIMKLDAGDETTFRSYNRPARRVEYQQVLDGLARLEDVTVQALIASGTDGNDDPAHLERWVERVATISPSAVQIYTLDRPVPSAGLSSAALELLERLAGQLQARGVQATVYLRRS
jgi:wyosine [tRNA(Phe)-imidazoG37] synthetase (radical SAM superfamily)